MNWNNAPGYGDEVTWGSVKGPSDPRWERPFDPAEAAWDDAYSNVTGAMIAEWLGWLDAPWFYETLARFFNHPTESNALAFLESLDRLYEEARETLGGMGLLPDGERP